MGYGISDFYTRFIFYLMLINYIDYSILFKLCQEDFSCLVFYCALELYYTKGISLIKEDKKRKKNEQRITFLDSKV